MRRAILITIDGWGTNLLGTYGNPLCETPHLDQLAAHGIVFDRCYASSVDVEEVLASIATGLHPLQPEAQPPCRLAPFLQAHGKQSIFLTDDPRFGDQDWVQDFNEAFCFDPLEVHASPSRAEPQHWAETMLATFVEVALGELTRYRDEEANGLPEWCWLHLSGLTRLWDAPYALRWSLCDSEEDPAPPQGSEPPCFEVDRSTDPDAVFGALCGASAQGILIDHLVHWIETCFEQITPRDELLLILMGSRGYPLGEHRSVGLKDPDPHVELVHLPLIVSPGRLPLGHRESRLVQPMSVFQTIREWLLPDSMAEASGVPLPAPSRLAASLLESIPSRDSERNSLDLAGRDDGTPSIDILIEKENVAALHSQRWTAVWPHLPHQALSPNETKHPVELYLAPDDRWEQNDVADRMVEVAEAMIAARLAWHQWLRGGGADENYPARPEILDRPIV